MSSDPQNTRGFVYVATGSGYLEEAVRSAESVRKHHPAVPICLVTDQPVGLLPPFTDIVRPAGAVEHKPIDKLLAIEAPYARGVFLDTDTFALGDLMEIFELLDRFPLAAHQDVNRGWNYRLPGVPAAFSEFNTGVIGFRNDPEVRSFFREWRGAYDRLKAEHGFVNDQPAFRQALYRSALRIAPLPSEYHFLGNFPNAALWKIRLIHARGDYGLIARDANGTLGGRAYIPGVGVVPAFAGRRGWLRVTLRTFARMLKLVFRPPADSASYNPRRWWIEEGKKPDEKK